MYDQRQINQFLDIATATLTAGQKIAAAFGLGDIKNRITFLIQRAASRDVKGRLARTAYWQKWYAEHAKGDRVAAQELLIVAALD